MARNHQSLGIQTTTSLVTKASAKPTARAGLAKRTPTCLALRRTGRCLATIRLERVPERVPEILFAADLMERSMIESTRREVRGSPRSVERHDSANVAQDAIAELDPKALAASATAAMATSDQSNMPEGEFSGLEPTNDGRKPNSPLRSALGTDESYSLAVRSPLTPQVKAKAEMQPPSLVIDTITASPTLSRHAIPVAHGTANILPVVHPASPMYDTECGSPQKDRLPSFRQLTGQLSELAEAAATHEPQLYSHHHSHSFGSTTSQSPRLPYHTTTFSASTQTSPMTHYAYALSPTSAISEMPHQTYGSPQQYASAGAYFNDRRTSTAAESAALFLPSLLPASVSAGESYGHNGSGAEGYSTSHTTPIDRLHTGDGTPRPVLPPPPGMPQNMVLLTGFSCDQPGCTAAPFQTQYLLR